MGLSDIIGWPRRANLGLWDSQVPEAVRQSVLFAQRHRASADADKWSTIRDFLDGVLLARTMAYAATSHAESSKLWDLDDGHAYRLFRLTEMLAERLSVIFHTPPTLRLAVDGVPLEPDDPVYGDQVRQWERDQDFAQLDTLLPYIDASVSGLLQQIVMPSWMSDGDIEGIEWQVYDPQDVYVHQSLSMPQRIDAARSVSVLVRQPLDTIEARPVDLWSTWTRTVEGSAVSYEHWLHTDQGIAQADPLFGARAPANGYGLLPFALWQLRRPSSGSIFLPPDEALIQDQLGLCVDLTDLVHGLRYQLHPALFGRGQRPAGKLVLSPDKALWSPDTDTQLDAIQLELQSDVALRVHEWLLRACATSRSLPPDILNPGAARNLAALKEQRHDLMLRRERVKPHYLRALRETFRIHKRVGNYWASQGADRVAYSEEIELHVRLAPIPEVQDPWQAAQARQLDMEAGITQAAEELADLEGIPIEEARRRVEANLEANRRHGQRMTTPGPAAPTGTQRPGDVQRS